MLNLTYVEIEKLKTYENNIKEHTEEQIKNIAKSIQETDFNDPIGITPDYEIVEGHGRYYAAKLLNLKKVPCIVISGDPEKIRLYRILHNKCCLDTGFDKDKLVYELNSLKIEGIDIEAFGFTIKDLETSEIKALDAINNESFTSLADEIKNESSIFTISFNFPIEMREKIEEFIRVKTKEYFVNKIIEEMEGE